MSARGSHHDRTGADRAAGEESLRPAAASAEDLVLVEDTREQRPLRFSARVRVVRAALPAGDYAPLGYETRAALERKSLADFVQSVTHERDRFWRELDRLRGYELRGVVVEGCIIEVLQHRYRSMASPRSVIASSHAIVTDFDIPVIWAHDPALAAECVEWMLRRFVVRAGSGRTEPGKDMPS